MKFRASLVRLTALLAASLLVGGFWATSAFAGAHSLTGNGRVQIGNGLPIPITGAAPPKGRIKAIVGATVLQTEGSAPQKMRILPGQLTAPGNPVNLGVFAANSNVFQVKTAITIQAPGQKATFEAGGRTGPSTYTYCANNPGCAGPGDTGNAINGLMRYTKTANQFGGPSQGAAGGSADVALRAASPAPCKGGGATPNPSCLVAFALATPDPTGAQGGPFGFVNGTVGMAPANGVYLISVTGMGVITNVVAGPFAAGVPNPATSYGGPYTTGMLTVSVTENVGQTSEVFTLTGSDMRNASGVGTISLVAGSVSDRTLSGPNANRGWLNLTIGPEIPLTPSMTNHGIAAFVGLLALCGGYLLHRRMTA